MQNENTSLANRYIRYAMSTAPSGKNTQLAALSQEEFMAVPHEARDIVWLAHCISRCPAYKMEGDMALAASELVHKNFSISPDQKKIRSSLEKDPELYTAPFPVMWFEWDETDDGSSLNGILVENLVVQNRAGIKVTPFGFRPESGVFPTLNDPIPIAYGTLQNLGSARYYPQDTPAYASRELIEKHPERYQQQAGIFYVMALSALTILKSRTDLKLIPATELIDLSAAIGIEQANMRMKPVSTLTFNPSGNLKFQTGNIIELMRKEQQELTAMAETRRSPEIALMVNSNVRLSKPDSRFSSLRRLWGRKTQAKDVVVIDHETSLASQFIRYGISTGSEERNAELGMFSLEELLAIPTGERDHAWFAHCIQKCPGYTADLSAVDAIDAFERQTVRTDDTTKKRVEQILIRQPELYTPSVPAMWVEFEVNDGKMRRAAYLLEKLPGNKPGLQGTFFFLSDTHGVMPQRGKHYITHFTTETLEGELATISYRNNIPTGRPQNESDRALAFAVVNAMHFMLALNDPTQPLKLTPPLSQYKEAGSPALGSSAAVDKPLGVMALSSPSPTFAVIRALESKGNGVLPFLRPAKLLEASGDASEPENLEDKMRRDREERQENARRAKEEKEKRAKEAIEAREAKAKEEEERRKKIPEAVALNGAVIQRIFREAGKSHPSNSPEREDDIARMVWLSEELRTLASLDHLNAKFAPHGELAGVLFGDEVMRAVEFSHLLPNGKNKVPVVSPEIQKNLTQRLIQVFAIASDDTNVPPDDFERNERLKQRIMGFPGLIIAGLGNDRSLRELRDKYNIPLHSDVPPAESNSVKRIALAMERNEKARTILTSIGIELPAIEVEIPPAEDSLVKEPQETNEQPVNQASGSAQTEEGIQAPKVFTSIIAAPDVKISTASVDSLTDDEKLLRSLKYDEAFTRTEARLLADAQMYLTRALNRGCNQFDCLIDLNKPGFAIHLRFSGEVNIEGENRTRKQFHVLDKYDEAYRELEIPLTMENAVDLKIAVQSLIYNTEGIVAARYVSAQGSPTVALDTQMPLPVLDYSVIQRSGGMYALIFEAKDPYTKKLIYPSIPLGFAARYEDEAAEQRELEARTEFVIDYLDKVGSYRTPEGFRTYVCKRDVMAKLQSWLESNNKEWETAERIALPGFETNTLIHVSPQGSQKITLAPVSLAMDVGGENPSWHCGLHFYIGDKDKPPRGELVRTRSFYLRTRNSRLAIARTLETLVGVKAGSKDIKGLLPNLQHHMLATGHEWRVEKGDKGDEVFIGNVKLQDFLDDMMRYERDIGVKLEKHEETTDSDIRITLQALRCLNGDHGGTVDSVPEYVHEKQGDTRRPIALTLIVSRDKAASIDAFVKEVHRHVNWLADEAYSSVALGKSGQPDKRKNPLEYRAVQIRNAVIRAVEAMYESHFGQKLPKNWHKPDIQPASSLGPIQGDSPVIALG